LQRLTSVRQQALGGGVAPNGVAEKRVDFTYNNAGQFDTLTRYANVSATEFVLNSFYHYDPLGRLDKLVHTTNSAYPTSGWGTGAVAGYTFGYDLASNIVSMASKVDGGAGFSYDDTNQLTGSTGGSVPATTFGYDANGNRTSSSAGTYPDQEQYFPTIGANNQLLSDGIYSYTYDDEGNRDGKTHIASGQMTVYEYDHRNRLTKATDWLVGPYPAVTGEGAIWGRYLTSGSTPSLGDPNAGLDWGWWGWGSDVGNSSTEYGAITFDAEVDSATEGNQVVLILNASASVQLEYWMNFNTAIFANGEAWLTTQGQLVASSDTVWASSSGPTQVTFSTIDKAGYSPTRSIEIHVRAVGDPSSEIILEGDIFNDDAIAFSAYADPVKEGKPLNAMAALAWESATSPWNGGCRTWLDRPPMARSTTRTPTNTTMPRRNTA
jgi:YD repeat-containing protein